MLRITIPKAESYDERSNTFINSEEVTLELEHSLVSLSKWESIWEKPFIGDQEKSVDETLSYVQCMALNMDVSLELLHRLDSKHLNQINGYIEAKMSATWFNEKPQPGQPKKSKEVITSELIYYWMGIYKIWKECEHWHLNRLFTLIKVHNAKNEAQDKKKPRSKAEMLAERRKLNEQRRAAHNTTG
jgi:hypothetical protein